MLMDLLDLYHFQCNPVYSVRIERCMCFGTMIKNQRKYESIQSKLFRIKADLRGTLFFSEQMYSIMNEGSCIIPCVIPCNPQLLLPALALYSPQHCCMLLSPLFIKWGLQLSDLRSLRAYFGTVCALCSVRNWWETLPTVLVSEVTISLNFLGEILLKKNTCCPRRILRILYIFQLLPYSYNKLQTLSEIWTFFEFKATSGVRRGK